ncbi:MAG TPA: DUF3034 family protein [Capsulimonadaceae bacterium]|jgi:hypothetical protein
MKTRSFSAYVALLALALPVVSFATAGPVRAADKPAADTAQPLPFHSIEGPGGGAITPTAYLSNPTPGESGAGKPAFAISYVNLDRKSLTALTASETLYGRLELSVGADQLELGTLPANIKAATTVDINRSSVWLLNLNARYLAVKEAGQVPAVTVGAHYKYNGDIKHIDEALGGALTSIGYKDRQGVDFTVTASKLFPKVGDHPLITTLGLRESKAANLGFLGFGKSYKTSVEGSLIYLPTSNIVVAYEVRQKTSPYGRIPGLIGGENTWHAVDVSYIVNPHSTIVAGYGRFGTLADKDANNAYWFQLKTNL